MSQESVLYIRLWNLCMACMDKQICVDCGVEGNIARPEIHDLACSVKAARETLEQYRQEHKMEAI